MNEVLDDLLSQLSNEARELYLDSCVTELDAAPRSLVFLRDYVSMNKPVVVRGAAAHWPAVKKWTPDYLRQKIGEREVTVSVTPNGFADAVTTFDNGEVLFMLPEERRMLFSQFLDLLQSASQGTTTHECNSHISNDEDSSKEKGNISITTPPSTSIREEYGSFTNSPDTSTSNHCCREPATCIDCVQGHSKNAIFYIQKQNSNLSDEFQELSEDVMQMQWAEEAFDKSPDAVNFWMGDSRAITSVHKDHYENIYCVISGTKTFTLIPPTDQPFLPYEEFMVARYKSTKKSGEFELVYESDIGKIPWIPIDVLKPHLMKYPEYSRSRPVTVTLHAGDLLYLPSLWYHHVQQSHACIAVNYWYDMNFDIKYCYYKFIESLLAERRRRNLPKRQLHLNERNKLQTVKSEQENL